MDHECIIENTRHNYVDGVVSGLKEKRPLESHRYSQMSPTGQNCTSFRPIHWYWPEHFQLQGKTVPWQGVHRAGQLSIYSKVRPEQWSVHTLHLNVPLSFTYRYLVHDLSGKCYWIFDVMYTSHAPWLQWFTIHYDSVHFDVTFWSQHGTSTCKIYVISINCSQ